MTPGATPSHRLSDRLGFRLGLVLSMALLPVGLIAVIQADKLLTDSQAQADAAMAGEVLRAVAPGMRLIRQAQGAASALAASALPVLSQPMGGCSQTLRAVAAPGTPFTSAQVVAGDGKVLCTSDLSAIAGDDAVSPDLLGADHPMLAAVTATDPSAPPVIQAASPVWNALGARTGTVVLSVSPDLLGQAFATALPRTDLAVLVFDADGSILMANRPTAGLDALSPQDSSLTQLAQRGEAVFRGLSGSAEPRAFSVVSLADPGLFALGSRPAVSSALSLLPGLPAAAFPALMWAVSLVAAFLAAELLVTRHIRDLRAAIMRFAQGHRALSDLDMSLAPGEIRDATEAFVQLTETILRDEAELEHSLHQKEGLLREVHHRVKNNLQLIASIISMQMRETGSAEARQLMRAVQDRVISLATVHKDLYLTSDMTEVRADDLLPEIVQQVITLAAGSGAHIQVERSFCDLMLTPDQAVPLALLLAEVVTHARNEVLGDGGLPRVSVTLARDGKDRALLVVAHAIEPSALVVPGASMQTGLGRQLIDAFAAQLDGAVRFSEVSGSHRMELRFPVDWTAQQPGPASA
jgi:two-component sensor histidine kinase